MEKGLAALTHLTYNTVIHALSPALAGWLTFRLLVQRKGRRAIRDWFGSYQFPNNNADRTPRLWVHAVSVGEVIAASTVIHTLRQRMKDASMFVTCITDTGRDTAARTIPEADQINFLPLDFPWFMTRGLRRIKPHVLVLVEGELWPNLLHAAKECGINVLLINGRISDTTISRARSIARPFYNWILSYVDCFAMRSEMDAERLLSLGVDAKKVTITGDVKLDHPQTSLDPIAVDTLRAELGLDEGSPVWIAGSTHSGEEAHILRAHRLLQKKFPNLRLILAPRHCERTSDVEAIIRDFGMVPKRRTANAPSNNGANPPILILDTIGELSKIYATADAAFVGGSLIRRGGHNMIEPLLKGKPVVFGPHINNFRHHAQWIIDSKLGSIVWDSNQLAAAIGKWLGSERAETAQRAKQLLDEHRGAADRTAALIQKFTTGR